jgi:glutathione S-transferase
MSWALAIQCRRRARTAWTPVAAARTTRRCAGSQHVPKGNISGASRATLEFITRTPYTSRTPNCFALRDSYRANNITLLSRNADASTMNDASTRSKCQEYALGALFTVVDPFWLVFYRWGMRSSYDMRNKFPAYTAYAERLCNRSSVQRSLTAEGISVWI